MELQVPVWTILVLSLLSSAVTVNCLTCWTRSCQDGSSWCHQVCAEEETTCAAYYTVQGPNDIIPSLLFSCVPALPDSCLNTRCDLAAVEGTAVHHCCCRDDLCNAVDGIVDGVSPPTEGSIPTPSGTLPIPSNGNIVCESFTEEEHLYKSCSTCTATYKLIAEDNKYQLDTKQCLNSAPTGSTCNDSCSLDTFGNNIEISCCCSSYLCNAYTELSFSDASRVSDYVHITPCDSSNCTHSCVVVGGHPTCLCDNGHSLEADGITCTDINECNMRPCSHQCVNNVGSFSCVCPPVGFRLQDDKITCEEVSLTCFSNTSPSMVQYCDDVMNADTSVPECIAIYGLLEDGTFEQQLAGCFSKDEVIRCTTPTAGACVLSLIQHNTVDDTYICCCTDSHCNVKSNTVFPSITNETVTAPTTIIIDNTTDVLTSPTLEPTSVMAGGIIGLICVGVILLVLVVLCLILCCVCCKKKKRSEYELAHIPNIEPIEASHADDIRLLTEIGRGRFAVVYYATRGDSELAVKCFEVKESFTKELTIYLILTNFQHQNVLKFISYVDNLEENKYWIVFEHHKNGSLYSLLQHRPVTLKEFCALSESIACGLAFLHSEFTENQITKPCVLHRDLKSKNILVKADGQCAISDFGLSVLCPFSDQDCRGQVGTSRYMAPEVLDGCIKFSRPSYKQIDCYSVGIIFSEIMSRTELNGEDVPDYRPPFDDRVTAHPSIQEMREVVYKEGYRPPLPDRFLRDGSCDKLTEMIPEVWDTFPEARLTAEAISMRLTSFKLAKFTDSKAVDSGYENETPSTPSSSILAASPSPSTLKHPSLGYSTSYTTETTV